MVGSRSTMPAPVGLSTESAALCALARRRAQDSDRHPAFAADGHPIDWDELITLADRHGVTELLLAPLQKTAVAVPPHILQLLEERHVAVTAQNLGRLTQLTDLLTLLRSQDIRAIPFKGPTLAAGTFGHIGRRLSNDLDILVSRAHIDRVRALMIADGYLPPPPRGWLAGSLFLGLYPGAGRDETFLPGHASRVTVEVHVGFAHWALRMRLSGRDLIGRSITEDIAGRPSPTLSAEDLLLVLSIHGMMHGWSVLRFVSDIDAVAERVTDWPAVVDRARSGRLRRPLWVALLLARRMMGTELAPWIATMAERDRRAMTIVEGAAVRMFDPTWTNRRDPGILDRWFRSFQERPLDRLMYLTRALTYEWVLKWGWDRWLGRSYHSRDGSR